MAYELKDGQGSLFKNSRKTTDRHPDYTGSAKVDGTEYFLDAWIKEGAKGKWMSVALKPKTERIGKTGLRQSAHDDEVPPF